MVRFITHDIFQLLVSKLLSVNCDTHSDENTVIFYVWDWNEINAYIPYPPPYFAQHIIIR
jgi:hypothetical protein